MLRRILAKGHHRGKNMDVRSAAGCREGLSEVGSVLVALMKPLHGGRSFTFEVGELQVI